MVISVWSKKGGVGKTSIAYNLARDLGFFLISNDDSVIEKAYPGKAKIINSDNLKLVDNCIYDFGGFVDAHTKEILKVSDFVIIPVEPDLSAFKKTVSTIGDLKAISQDKIIVVLNKIDNFNDEDLNAIRDHFKKENITFVEMPTSKIFKKSFKKQSSIMEICNQSNFNRYTYRKICKYWENLLSTIKKEKK